MKNNEVLDEEYRKQLYVCDVWTIRRQITNQMYEDKRVETDDY